MGEQSDNVVAESSETTIKVSFGVKRTVTKLIKPTTEVTSGRYFLHLILSICLSQRR